MLDAGCWMLDRSIASSRQPTDSIAPSQDCPQIAQMNANSHRIFHCRNARHFPVRDDEPIRPWRAGWKPAPTTSHSMMTTSCRVSAAGGRALPFAVVNLFERPW